MNMEFINKEDDIRSERQKEIAEDISNDEASNNLCDDLHQLILEIQNNLSTIYYDDPENLLIQVVQIITHLDDIPTYFIENLNCVSLFSQILQQTNDSMIFESCLIILQSLIYLSPIAYDVFMQLDLTELLMNSLLENSTNFNYEGFIITTILGIIQKMSEDQNSHINISVIPQLFNFIDNCHDQINSTKVNLDDNTVFSQSIKICIDIFDSFIRFYDNEIINQFLNQFLEIETFLQYTIFQKGTISIFCDLAEKGFIDDIIESDLYQSCLALLNEKSSEKSYQYIIRLIGQILNIFEDSNKEDRLELNQSNLNRFVPFETIYNLLKNINNDKTKIACLLLYEKISSIGGLKILLDNGENYSLLNEYLENGNYIIKSKIYHLLWKGLINLDNFDDQISIINSSIFNSMTSNADIQDDCNFLFTIFPFFEHILSIAPRNSNSGDPQSIDNLSVSDESFACIENFACECSKSDNEELVEMASSFLDNYCS